MAWGNGRHGGHTAIRCEPPSPGLLREILAILKAPEPPPRLPQEEEPGRIAAALAAESARNPAWTCAVVFRTSRPVRMDINEGRDYYLFPAPWQARKVMRDDQSLDGPQMWVRSGSRWHPAG